MAMLLDFFAALKQYIEEKGNNKLSYYLQLLHEYKEDRDENLQIAKDFIHADLENWE